jgi:NCS2 family nucleobase:cation symporter-2
MIGVVPMHVGVNWASGGAGTPELGSVENLAVAGLVLAVVLPVIKFGRGFVQNTAVLIGIAGDVPCAGFQSSPRSRRAG